MALTACLILATCSRSNSELAGYRRMTWAEIEDQARGQTVNLTMWMGDDQINRYMADYVCVKMKERYGVTLKITAGMGNQVVTTLLSEKEAARTSSEVGMAWINGATFFRLRQIDALFGPVSELLPNSAYIDYHNPFIAVDFQQKIEGYETPWGNVQFTLIYNSDKVKQPPATRQELSTWIRNNPGRFTFNTQFTGMTFLKCLFIDCAGGSQTLAGPFDEKKYQRYAPDLWAYINSSKKYYWREGRSFPNELSELHNLFVAGEVDFTMSNNDGEVDSKVLHGVFPNSSRAYVLEAGTIQNSHYIGIIRNAPHKAGALVVINFLISPEAQLAKMDPAVWGDGTILDMEKIPPSWVTRFANIPNRRYAPDRGLIQARALMELAPEYMIRLTDDFRKQVLAD